MPSRKFNSIQGCFDNFVYGHGGWFSGASGSTTSSAPSREFVSTLVAVWKANLKFPSARFAVLILRPGVQLERRPIERLLEHGVSVSGMKERELGVSKGGSWIFALA